MRFIWKAEAPEILGAGQQAPLSIERLNKQACGRELIHRADVHVLPLRAVAHL